MKKSVADKSLVIVGIAGPAAFLAAMWIMSLSDFVKFFLNDLVWLALWAVVFSILVVAYVYKTGCSTRLARLMMGGVLLMNGVIINSALRVSEQRLLEWRDWIESAHAWHVPLLFFIEFLYSLKDIGAIGIAAIGASIIGSAMLERTAATNGSADSAEQLEQNALSPEMVEKTSDLPDTEQDLTVQKGSTPNDQEEQTR
ncbi:MAG: hypothetical protein LAT61_03115 [Alcanivorax sp.]|nr:hypothetical protein [Alcanivorax sp.]